MDAVKKNLCNEYWATIPPKTDLRCLAFTLVQQFHNNPPHVTDITVGKKRTERKWLRNRSSTATQQISHAHTLEDKRREMLNSCPKNCMLLPEEIQHAASFTSPSRQQVAFILLQPPCSVTLNHSETPPPPFREWKITYKMARPD